MVFDKTTRTSFGADGRNDPSSRSGLLIRRKGRTIATKMCDIDSPIKPRARQMIQEGTFVPH